MFLIAYTIFLVNESYDVKLPLHSQIREYLELMLMLFS